MSELEIFRRQNFGNPIGFGRRSALLVVDSTVGFNDPALFGGGNTISYNFRPIVARDCVGDRLPSFGRLLQEH